MAKTFQPRQNPLGNPTPPTTHPKARMVIRVWANGVRTSTEIVCGEDATFIGDARLTAADRNMIDAVATAVMEFVKPNFAWGDWNNIDPSAGRVMLDLHFPVAVATRLAAM